MSRGRIISQVLALYAGPTPSTGGHYSSGTSGTNLINQLFRIQSCNFNADFPRINVNQFGELAAIDRISITTPSVPLTFGYYLANLWNESKLGFTISGPGSSTPVSAISGILNKTSDDKNYFLMVQGEGNDAVGSTVAVGGAAQAANVWGFGNGFITSYSVKGAVGSIPEVTIGVEALNLAVDAGLTGNNIPAINPIAGNEIYDYRYQMPTAVSNAGTGDLALSVLRPGDISVSIVERNTQNTYNEPGASISDAKIQSFDLSFNLARSPIEKLGSRFAISREINSPVEVKLGVNAILGDLSTGSLADMLCDNTQYDVYVTLKKTACSGSGPVIAQYLVKNINLDSMNYANGISNNSTVDLSFTSQIGGPQSANGLFMSGIYQ